jgi:hypothetical protein
MRELGNLRLIQESLKMKKRLLSLISSLALIVCLATAASAQTKKPLDAKLGEAGQDSIDPKQHVAFCKELKAEENHLEALLSAHQKHKGTCTNVKSPLKGQKGTCSDRAAALDRCLSMTLGEIKSEWNEHKCSAAGTITKKP